MTIFERTELGECHGIRYILEYHLHSHLAMNVIRIATYNITHQSRAFL
jgi:hypothetical protein